MTTRKQGGDRDMGKRLEAEIIRAEMFRALARATDEEVRRILELSHGGKEDPKRDRAE